MSTDFRPCSCHGDPCVRVAGLFAVSCYNSAIFLLEIARGISVDRKLLNPLFDQPHRRLIPLDTTLMQRASPREVSSFADHRGLGPRPIPSPISLLGTSMASAPISESTTRYSQGAGSRPHRAATPSVRDIAAAPVVGMDVPGRSRGLSPDHGSNSRTPLVI